VPGSPCSDGGAESAQAKILTLEITVRKGLRQLLLQHRRGAFAAGVTGHEAWKSATDEAFRDNEFPGWGRAPLLTAPGACGRIRESMIEPDVLRRIVRAALDEDVGSGDLTSRLVVDGSTRARGRIMARESLTVAGLQVAEEVFRQVDASIVYHPECADGAARSAGECCAMVEGVARSILAAERTALNFLQRMSGIATATRRAVSHLDGARVQISETRKTAPGLPARPVRCRPHQGQSLAAGGRGRRGDPARAP